MSFPVLNLLLLDDDASRESGTNCERPCGKEGKETTQSNADGKMSASWRQCLSFEADSRSTAESTQCRGHRDTVWGEFGALFSWTPGGASTRVLRAVGGAADQTQTFTANVTDRRSGISRSASHDVRYVAPPNSAQCKAACLAAFGGV